MSVRDRSQALIPESDAPTTGVARRPRVVFMERRLPHYRVPFFVELRRELERRGYEFVLAVGDPTPEEALKRDGGTLPWAHHAPCRYFLGGLVCWQDVRHLLKDADFLVVSQENKLLFNWLALLWPSRFPRLGLWGHGRDVMARGFVGQVMQRIKAWSSCRADWWFAYTDLAARVVRDFGFPPDRITVVNNAGDTSDLQRDVASFRSAGRQALRESLGLAEGPVGLFIGSIYPEKRLDLVLAASRLVRERHPDFQLVIAGAGSGQAELAAQVEGLPWVRLAGVVKGEQKARWMAAADVLLLPAAVGLAIVDGFAAGLPVIVSQGPEHGPEVAYLEDGVNGVLTSRSASAYAQGLAGVLQDPQRARLLSSAALASAQRLSQQAAVQRFSQGIDTWHRSRRSAPHAALVERTSA
jgi:glycosyltransferase involved in cell wall biosynthesis